MKNKPVFYIFAVILLVGTASAYSWHTTITNYLEGLTCGNCTLSTKVTFGTESFSILSPHETQPSTGQKNIIVGFLDDNINPQFAYNINKPDDQTTGTNVLYSTSQIQNNVRVSNSLVSSITQALNGDTGEYLTIYDSGRANGYACWSGGALISQATPCV